MQTIGAILGSQIRPNRGVTPLLPNVGGLGLELELEGGRFEPVPGWAMHEDGSLRNGVEYVFDGPQGGSDALTSIENMGAAFAAMKPRPTFRCSTHCHLDVRDLTVLGVSKLFALYAINEDVMFDHCEEYRRWSNFCTPFYNALDLVDGFAGMVRSDLTSKKSITGAISVRNMRAFPKYSALNLQPVCSFGSVEFRGSHAITNAEELLALAQRMLHLKRVVLESPADESLEDFTHRVNKLALAEVFQQGLRNGYQRNREFADTCYSTAVRLLESVAPRATVAAPPIPPEWVVNAEHHFGEIQQGHAQVVAQDGAPNNFIYINEGVMAHYGLRNERRLSVANFCHLFIALRNMVGIRRPNLATLVDMDLTNAALVRTLPAELAQMGFQF